MGRVSCCCSTPARLDACDQAAASSGTPCQTLCNEPPAGRQAVPAPAFAGPMLPATSSATSSHRRALAGAGAKKRLEQNRRRLAALRVAILITTALYAGVRLYSRAATRSGWHWFGLVVTLLAHAVSYLAIAAVARPTFSNSGELLDGGGDLDRGTASAYHDIL